MASPAMKPEEKRAVIEFAQQAQLAPDTLSPKPVRTHGKITGPQSERILTPKDPYFAPTLALIKGICNDFAKKEEIHK